MDIPVNDVVAAMQKGALKLWIRHQFDNGWFIHDPGDGLRLLKSDFNQFPVERLQRQLFRFVQFDELFDQPLGQQQLRDEVNEQQFQVAELARRNFAQRKRHRAFGEILGLGRCGKTSFVSFDRQRMQVLQDADAGVELNLRLVQVADVHREFHVGQDELLAGSFLLAPKPCWTGSVWVPTTSGSPDLALSAVCRRWRCAGVRALRAGRRRTWR